MLSPHSFLFEDEDPMAFLGGGTNITLEDDPPKNIPPDDIAKKAAAEAKQKEEDEKKKKAGKGKEDQVGELRRQRDDLARENEELKKAKEELDKLKGVKPVAEYIEKKFGKLDQDAVNKFIEHNKERKTKFLDLEKKYGEKEAKVRDLEITHSDLWRDDYQIPLKKANDDLFASIVMVDKDGKVRYPELFNKLKEDLLLLDKDNKPKNSIQIKQTLKEFATEFKRQTQEDYDIPMLTEVTVAVENTYNKFVKAIEAKKEWEKTVEEKNKEKLYDNHKKIERDTKAIIIQREKVLDFAKEEFKYDLLDGIFKPEEVKEEFDKSHNNVVEIMTGKQKPTEYNVFSEKMVKASLFDSLIEKYKELEKKYEKDLGKKHSSLGSGSAQDRRNNERREEPKGEPLDFLK